MSSLPEGKSSGLGFSVEGSIVRSHDTLSKAIVRGVAVTPVPAQVETLCTLVKSLSIEIEIEVEKKDHSGLDRSQALELFQARWPNFSMGFAKRVVDFTFKRLGR
jgi:hypothetical protein